MSMTVTLQWGTGAGTGVNGYSGVHLLGQCGVYVLNGVSLGSGAQLGATADNQDATNYGDYLSITPNATGSLLFGLWVGDTGGADNYPYPQVPYSAATTIDATMGGVEFGGTAPPPSDESGGGCVLMHSTNPTTASTPVTIGCANSIDNNGDQGIQVFEILAANPDVPVTIDASSPAYFPAPVNNTSDTFYSNTETSASFTPPANAVLLAVAAKYGGSTTVSATDTSGGTYTWHALTLPGSGFAGEGMAWAWVGVPAPAYSGSGSAELSLAASATGQADWPPTLDTGGLSGHVTRSVEWGGKIS